MIRVNLLENQYGADASALDQLDVHPESGTGRRKWLLAAAAGLALAVGGGIFYATSGTGGDVAEETTIPAPAAPEPAGPRVAAADTADAADAAKDVDTAKVASKAQADSAAKAAELAKAKAAEDAKAAKAAEEEKLAKAKAAEAEKAAQEAKAAEEEKLAMARAAEEAKAAKAAQAEQKPARAAAAVVAPPLPANALDDVLRTVRTKPAVAATPASFEKLPASARTAYQRFAFERLLSIVRQVTPPAGIGYYRIRLLSPGILSIEGEASGPEDISVLLSGLKAQNLEEAQTLPRAANQFTALARLPFSPPTTQTALSQLDFAKALLQAQDLAAAQGLKLAPPAPRGTSEKQGLRRGSWTVTGTGSFDAVAGWLSSLQTAGSALGLTELVLQPAASAGMVKISATVVAYSL